MLSISCFRQDGEGLNRECLSRPTLTTTAVKKSSPFRIKKNFWSFNKRFRLTGSVTALQIKVAESRHNFFAFRFQWSMVVRFKVRERNIRTREKERERKCVCESVCVKERERETERGAKKWKRSFLIPIVSFHVVAKTSFNDWDQPVWWNLVRSLSPKKKAAKQQMNSSSKPTKLQVAQTSEWPAVA